MMGGVDVKIVEFQSAPLTDVRGDDTPLHPSTYNRCFNPLPSRM